MPDTPRDDFPTSGVSCFVNSVTDCVVGFGKRLLIHATGLVLGAIAGLSFTVPGGDPWDSLAVTFPAALGTYIGTICLLPRGISNKPGWVIPSVAGAAVSLLWFTFGVPWQGSILWGGATTWVIRLLVKQGMMDWEWSVLPFLLIALFGFVSSIEPRLSVTPPYLLVPIAILGGWIALRSINRVRGDSSQRDLLEETCARLEKVLKAHTLPLELEGPAHQFAQNGRKLLGLKPHFDAATLATMRDAAKTALTLDRIGGNLSPTGVVKAQQKVSELNTALQKLITTLEPPKPKLGVDAALQKRIDDYKQKVQSAIEKGYALPVEMQTQLRAISASTDNIISCMLDDPTDIIPADKFLGRYITSVHTVVDEYIKLSASGSDQAAVNETLERSKELLTRLEKAFASEHGKLLQNDTVNFTAELNVLDKLLKMDGK